MTTAIIQVPDIDLIVNLYPLPDISEDDFVKLCQVNPELRLERKANGEIVIMPPEGGESGNRGQRIGASLLNWSDADGTGAAFGSSTGFRLPNGATRSPDASWVRLDRLAELTTEEKRAFLPLCPDFVVEVRSPTDRLANLHDKMEEYIASGARLGWLIDPDTQTVHVYRPGRPVERVEQPARLTGDPELPGFVLELGRVWDLGF